jgi:hypothetical protein
MSLQARRKLPTNTEVIEGVPEDLMSQVTQDFRDSGAVVVNAEQSVDGTWTVTAVFPALAASR